MSPVGLSSGLEVLKRGDVQTILLAALGIFIFLLVVPVPALASGSEVQTAISVSTSSTSESTSGPAFTRRVHLDLAVFYASPTALQKGMVTGVLMHGALPVTRWLKIGSQMGVGETEASNLTYKLEHAELHALLTAETSIAIGRADLGLMTAAGVSFVNEYRSRHGSMRISAAGLEPATSAWTSGPSFRVGPRIRLNIVHRIDLLMQTDFTYTYAKVDEEYIASRGWFGLLGVGYRL